MLFPNTEFDKWIANPFPTALFEQQRVYIFDLGLGLNGMKVSRIQKRILETKKPELFNSGTIFSLEVNGEFYLIRPFDTVKQALVEVHEEMRNAKMYCYVGCGYQKNAFFKTQEAEDAFYALSEVEQLQAYINLKTADVAAKALLQKYLKVAP